MDVVNVLKVLGDESRIRIMNLLKEKSLCVCEIEGILSMSQSNVSRHLTRMTTAGLTRFEKDAKFIYYKLDEKNLDSHPYVRSILEEAGKMEVCIRDIERLKRYDEIGGSCDNIKDGLLLIQQAKLPQAR